MRTPTRILLALLAVVVVAIALAAARVEDVVLLAMSPTTRFDAAAAPEGPDYSEDAAWSALPGRVDAADATMEGLAAIDDTTAQVDVFYVHPTSYIGRDWNGPMGDATLNASTDAVATKIQASAFNGCCAVYAPRYRQANPIAFTRPTKSGEQAIALAYGDVRTAFGEFLSRRDPARPFFLVGHSQGAHLLRRLLEKTITGTPLRERLVAAYLIGAPLTEASLAREMRDLPVCASATQVGCVVGWNARAPGFVPGKLEPRGLDDAPGDPRVCVNPITWRTDGAPSPASANAGAVFLEATPPVRLPTFASAQCVDGTLVVDEIGAAPRDLRSRLLDRAIGAGNHHAIEVQMYYADLRANANDRAAAWLAGQAVQVEAAPAVPLEAPGSQPR
jgi:hypothetical protein